VLDDDGEELAVGGNDHVAQDPQSRSLAFDRTAAQGAQGERA
jgi:hypothetical protein